MVKDCASSAEGMGSIPGQGTKVQHAAWQKKKKNIKQKQETELHARNSRAASAGTGCDSMGLGEEVSHRGPHV